MWFRRFFFFFFLRWLLIDELDNVDSLLCYVDTFTVMDHCWTLSCAAIIAILTMYKDVARFSSPEQGPEYQIGTGTDVPSLGIWDPVATWLSGGALDGTRCVWRLVSCWVGPSSSPLHPHLLAPNASGAPFYNQSSCLAPLWVWVVFFRSPQFCMVSQESNGISQSPILMILCLKEK